VRRDVWTLESPATGGTGQVVAYGHWGVPVLFFPAEGGSAFDEDGNFRDERTHKSMEHLCRTLIETSRLLSTRIEA